jgi:hypothetical protein
MAIRGSFSANIQWRILAIIAQLGDDQARID